MIKEDPDYTIKDFVQLRDEIAAIKQASKIEGKEHTDLLKDIDKTLAA